MKVISGAVFATVLMAAACADAQTVLPIAMAIPRLQGEDPRLGKVNAYADLLNGSIRAVDSLRRYQSWVDMRTGPTGKERYISYGLYSLGAEQAQRVVVKARAAAAAAPPIPSLDAAAIDYAASFETLVPILNDASAYYERQDYKDDRMAGGKALHAKLVPAMTAFLAARARLESVDEAVSATLDQRELALIEQREGKSLRWHLQDLAIAAKAALAAIPRVQHDGDLPASPPRFNPNDIPAITPDDVRKIAITANAELDAMPNEPPDTTATGTGYERHSGDPAIFSAAIIAYADAVRGFDDANRAAGKGDQSSARELLARLRTLREKIEKHEARQNNVEDVLNQYNAVVELVNGFQ